MLKDRQIYKEFIQIILKVHNNFGMRDLTKVDEQMIMQYLNQMFEFTIASYKITSSSIKFHASKLNGVWWRLYFEAISLKINCLE